MCKESGSASPCPGCGVQIVWGDFHIPHCPNTHNDKIITALQERMGK